MLQRMSAMIICSCAVISSDDIERAVNWMRAADPQTIITPGKVYRALGKRPVCGGCAALFVSTVHSTRSQAIFSDMPLELRNLRAATKGRANHERRRQGNRIPESSASQ